MTTTVSNQNFDYEIVTPEGVSLRTKLATRSERAAAFLIDIFLCALVIFILLLLLVYLLVHDIGGDLLAGIILFMSFIIRAAYFLHFELVWRGATLGKRFVGIRVVDRNGGPLLPAAIIARNLTREFEIFMPFAVIISFPGAHMGQWVPWLSSAWILIFAAIPFLNRDRMRGGIS
jgi:uncharacterized RDD family membrane protein YckC